MSDKIKVTVQTVAGEAKVLEMDKYSTIKDAIEKMGLPLTYQAAQNGDPAELSTVLEEFSFISLSEQVKGGL